jgi:copper oxidase (laccase) domain-containing protein
MCRQGASAARIQAAMGPSICQECFEVGDEVVDAFRKAHFNLNDIVVRNTETGKAHIDLRAANRAVLVAAGVPVGNIAMSQHCSRCEHTCFFSARRLGINSGRTFTGIYLVKH